MVSSNCSSAFLFPSSVLGSFIAFSTTFLSFSKQVRFLLISPWSWVILSMVMVKVSMIDPDVSALALEIRSDISSRSTFLSSVYLLISASTFFLDRSRLLSFRAEMMFSWNFIVSFSCWESSANFPLAAVDASFTSLLYFTFWSIIFCCRAYISAFRTTISPKSLFISYMFFIWLKRQVIVSSLSKYELFMVLFPEFLIFSNLFSSFSIGPFSLFSDSMTQMNLSNLCIQIRACLASALSTIIFSCSSLAMKLELGVEVTLSLSERSDSSCWESLVFLSLSNWAGPDFLFMDCWGRVVTLVVYQIVSFYS